jgi:hypothetical protein
VRAHWELAKYKLRRKKGGGIVEFIIHRGKAHIIWFSEKVQETSVEDARLIWTGLGYLGFSREE